jgi:CBS domain-containing protein
MKVKEIMKTQLITIPKETSCKEAARILLKEKISGAPVVDDTGKLIGIISEKDVFRSLFPEHKEFHESPESYLEFEEMEYNARSAAEEKKVNDVMTDRLITANPETPILKIGALMIASGIHRVPVLKKGKLIGIATRRDIYRAIMREYFELWDVMEK